MTPEKIVQSEIMSYFAKLKSLDLPIMYDRRQAGGFSYKMGIPDLYAVYNGIHVEIEVKRPGGSQSPMQEKYEMMCKKCNILYICASSLLEVENFFKNNVFNRQIIERPIS